VDFQSLGTEPQLHQQSLPAFVRSGFHDGVTAVVVIVALIRVDTFDVVIAGIGTFTLVLIPGD
jgi:uncharacterized membrane protein